MPNPKTLNPTFFLLLLFLFIFLLLQNPKTINPKPPSQKTQSRRILRGHHHHPSLAIPPSISPLPSLPKYPSSSLPTPTVPSTSSFPFFPSLPSPPPPPFFATSVPVPVPTFGTDVSSTMIPTKPSSPSNSSHNILPAILLPLLCFSLLCLSLSLLLLHLRRRRRSSAGKNSNLDNVRLFPPPPPSTSNPSTEFLYLGTLANPRGTLQQPPLGVSGAADEHVGSGDVGSPELRPLPPLPRLVNLSGSDPSSVSDQELGLSSVSLSSSMATSSSSKELEQCNPPPLKRQYQNWNPNFQPNNKPTLKNVNNTMIDPKKVENISVLLTGSNVSTQQICEALLEGDGTKIGTEILQAILKMVPNKEEEQKLKQIKEDSNFKLNPSEEFLKELTKIPFVFKRVEALLFVSNFDSEVKKLKGIFGILVSACEELKRSELFHKLLQSILKVGNTHFGDVKAFKFDTFLKLYDIKSTNGEITLLDFVIKEVMKSENLGLGFVSSLGLELTNVKKAGTIDSNELVGMVLKLGNGVEEIRELVRVNGGSKFGDKMRVFLQNAEAQVVKVQEEERLVLCLVKEINEYFGGDFSDEKEEDLFRVFRTVRDFLSVLDAKMNGIEI